MTHPRRVRRLAALLAGGLAGGAALGACTIEFKISSERCASLCVTARTCGVIPSSIAGSATADDAEIYEQCLNRCTSSSSARSDVKTLIECLELYVAGGDADVCADGCERVRQCMHDAVNFGDLGAAALGEASLTVTMVPASFWMSTVEGHLWCPSDGETVPTLAAYYQREGLAAEAQALLLRAADGFDALTAALNAATDDAGRLAALDAIEAQVGGPYVLPPALIARLRRELAADGWSAVGVDNNDLEPGGCVRSFISAERRRIFDDVDPNDLASVEARLAAQISGAGAVPVFDGGYQACKQNASYGEGAGETEGAIDEEAPSFDSDGPVDDTPVHYRCARTIGVDQDRCQRFGKPLCREVDCDGGLAGCDPVICYFDGVSPSRACSELGITEIYLGYESDNTKYLSPTPITCDGATASVDFGAVTIGRVTPIAVVRGRIPGQIGVPGVAPLLCGHEDEDEGVAPADGAPRSSGSIFADPELGDYCWVIHGHETMIRAGDSHLIVPSPYVEYLKEAIKPAVRLGLVGVRPPTGCGCEISGTQCESLARGNCRDGDDNDGNGLADAYEPECARFYADTPFYARQVGDQGVEAGACETSTSG